MAGKERIWEEAKWNDTENLRIVQNMKSLKKKIHCQAKTHSRDVTVLICTWGHEIIPFLILPF